LRTILKGEFKRKEEDVMGYWRKLRNGEILICTPQYNIKIINQGR
jgi:hypothetical protein